MITRELVRKMFDYDPVTGVMTYKNNGSTGWYGLDGYLRFTLPGNKKYMAHRLIWLYVHGYFPPEQIDHINRIKDDNRLCNLREATPMQNARNKEHYGPGTCKHNTSGVKGVSWYRQTGKWRSQINVNNKNICLGYFVDKSDAVAARQNAEKYYRWNR